MATATLSVSPIGRVSYPHVFRVHENNNANFKDQYEITLLFPKSEPLTTLRADIEAAIEERWPDKKNRPRKLRSPIKDGDERWDEDFPEKNAEYKDHWYVQFKSKSRPGVVDSTREIIEEEDDRFRAGCYARVSYRAATYDMDVNKGVNLYLGNVQKTGDGEPFGFAKTQAEDDFDAIEAEDLI